MSSEKDMDDVKVKDGLPKFGPDRKAESAKTASAQPGAGTVGSNDNSPLVAAANAATAAVAAEAAAKAPAAPAARQVDEIKAMPSLRVIRGGAHEIIEFNSATKAARDASKAQAQAQTEVSTSSKIEKGIEANVGVDKDGVSASVGVSMKKTTEVKSGSAKGASASKGKGKFGLEDEAFIEALKAKGVDLSSGKIPLDVLAEVLAEMAGEAPNTALLDPKAHEKMLADISKRLSIGLREEKGAELRAGITAGGGGRPSRTADSAQYGSSVGAELVATGGALIGGLASLASGSARFIGAAVGAAGRGIGGWGAKPDFAGSRYDRVSVMPTISEYRLNQIEKSTSNYEKALEKFWQVAPMAALRTEIEERARKTGISVPDAMEKMKPGGDWGELHAKFVKEVAASPDALQAKVALDKALKSYTGQYEHSAEELMNADMSDEKNVKARNKVDASKDKMQTLAAETPVFGGETESHAERLKAAIEAIIARVRELLEAVGAKFTGGGAEHAAP